MRRFVIVQAVAALGCCLIAMGCGSEDTSPADMSTTASTAALQVSTTAIPSTTESPSTTAIPSTTESSSTSEGPPTTEVPPLNKWPVFEGWYVSLALPDAFTEDLGLVNELLQATGSDEVIPLDMESPDLFVVSKPGAFTAIASVAALFESDPEIASETMQVWVDSKLADIEFMFEDVEILSEDITKHRAEVVVACYYDSGSGSGGTPALGRALVRFVILTHDSWYCRVEYTYVGEQDAALDRVFEASAQTIEVTD